MSLSSFDYSFIYFDHCPVVQSKSVNIGNHAGKLVAGFHELSSPGIIIQGVQIWCHNLPFPPSIQKTHIPNLIIVFIYF